MNCQEVHEKLHPFVDGELTAEETAAVREALVDCPDCQTELDELEAVRSLAREAFEASHARAAEADLSSLFDGVMARLEADGALRGPAAEAAPAREPAPQPASLYDRFLDWLSSALSFDQPLATMALAAAVALIAGGIYWAQLGASQQSTQEIGGPARMTQQGTPAPQGPRPRRGMELEHRNVAEVESVEVAVGRVEIDDVGEDPDKPMVVWHIVDEGATSGAEQGL